MAKPLELENQSFLFFVTASVLAVTGVWAVYQEFFTRRPWKDFQHEFYDIETARARQEYEKSLAWYDSEETRAKRDEYQAKLGEAEAKIIDPENRVEQARLLSEQSELKERAGDKAMEITFAKSRLDAAFSAHAAAIHHGQGRSEYLGEKHVASLKEEIATLTGEHDAIVVELATVDAKVFEFTGPVEEYQKKLAALEQRVTDARMKVQKSEGRFSDLTQIWLPDIEVVDRCHICHMGINRPGYSDPAAVVAFANEVDDRDGDLEEVTRRYGIDAETIEAWVEMVDEGETPDDGIKKVFRTHPHRAELILGAHPPEQFACTPCHEGQGSQTRGIGAVLGGQEFDHGRNDHYYNWPMLELGDADTPPYVQASCTDCHAGDFHLDYAATLNQGQALVKKLACWGCHPIDGFPHDRKRGPTLEHLQAKTNPGWLVEWIKYPKAWSDSTSMPNFWPQAEDTSLPDHEREKYIAQRDEEATAIAAYLWTASSGAEGYLIQAPPPGDPVRGKALVDSVGCRGCHAIEKDDPVVASEGSATRAQGPHLARLAQKTSYEWLFSWVKDPAALWHDTVMPSLRLTDAEAADVAAYLSGLGAGTTYEAPAAFSDASKLELEAKKGKELVAYYGCFGCHDIAGFETAQRVGVDLSAFGRKMPSLFDYGNLVVEGSHVAVDPHLQTWENFAENKIRTPRIFEHMRATLKMPQFDLTDEEVRALLVFLKSRRAAQYPAKYDAMTRPRNQVIAQGEQLIVLYGCRGCHNIRGDGGQVVERYENESEAPPMLFSMGAKTKPEWLYGFLKDPASRPIRPWLEIRMPTYNLHGDDATRLVAYFNALDESRYPYLDEAPAVDAQTLSVGKTLFEKLQCSRCHPTDGDVGPDADIAALAPDLGASRQKLRHDWIAGWLADPAAQRPGSRMPAFWPDGLSPFPDTLGGDSRKQMDAVSAYLYSLGAKKRDRLPEGTKTAQR